MLSSTGLGICVVPEVNRILWMSFFSGQKGIIFFFIKFFGFYNMLGKYAAIIGTALMGTISLVTGSARLGILSILLLFILGAFLLNKVDLDEGKRLAADGL